MENSMKTIELSDEQLAIVTGGFGSAKNFNATLQFNITNVGAQAANGYGINQVAPTNNNATLQVAVRKTFFF